MANPVERIRMKDGRILAYYEFGDVQGKPVFYFHSAGAGSGLFAESYHTRALRNGIRLIALDRPGIGKSGGSKQLSSVDNEILSDPVFQKLYAQSLLNAYKQGNRSILQDLRICSSGWGFEPGEVNVKTNF